MPMLNVVMAEFFIPVVSFYEKDKNTFCYDFWKLKANGIYFFKQKIVVGSILRIITKESEMHCFSEYN